MYSAAFRHCNIDGALLLTLDTEDFVSLGMLNTVHVKRLLLTIERRPQVLLTSVHFVARVAHILLNMVASSCTNIKYAVYCCSLGHM
jgi:SAM domain (Sterile alpha motif)